MKVKLLKKIRKEYSILQVNKIDKRINNIREQWYREFERTLGLPFFILEENTYYNGYKTLNEAKEAILYTIRKQYAKYSCKGLKNINGEKVWYNQKIK